MRSMERGHDGCADQACECPDSSGYRDITSSTAIAMLKMRRRRRSVDNGVEGRDGHHLQRAALGG
ncbi:hypothetical protein A8E25_19785 [Burkholderia cenocepacia]|uniref:Uncharacterized protein n=1 Tax=Bordetella genomosp. 9 TaxID=1416803 RepID=A0A1W6YVG8_9BORD|nr:hypothetical protein WK22_04490 [Burkholderia multivorans]ARP85077.1 hypothetical protein CAL13_01725 [Bordetella genomosp. 9]ONR49932.1 hypothetical protein A8E17_34590 [Burkholderia cenocepacia]ONR66525.1 hypothetical protein A8E18_25580 [Burkholderia cenocepacia]ONR90539.1 hypothetical protein A8E25_19785 [Burkholderia cenocepacia]